MHVAVHIDVDDRRLARVDTALKRGFEVALVVGPVGFEPIYDVKTIPVTSSEQMTAKTLEEEASADEDFKRVYDSYRAFRKQYEDWSEISERSYQRIKDN